MQDDHGSRLQPMELKALGFLIDLEDRGSEWPDLRRVINFVGVTSPVGASLLGSLADRGLVDLHVNLSGPSTQYAITRSGRACYFDQSDSDLPSQ